jgi:hypothetical protein
MARGFDKTNSTFCRRKKSKKPRARLGTRRPVKEEPAFSVTPQGSIVAHKPLILYGPIGGGGHGSGVGQSKSNGFGFADALETQKAQQTAPRLLRHTQQTYGHTFKTDLFEQYKIYVGSVEKVSDRRVLANNCLLTVNAFLAVLYGLFAGHSQNSAWLVLLPVVGVLVSLVWYRIIASYRNLNAIKFQVIHELEQKMPAALYDYEWFKAEEGRGKAFRPLSHLELWLPRIFVLLYALLIITGAMELLQ